MRLRPLRYRLGEIGTPPGEDPIESDPGGGIIVVPTDPPPVPVLIEYLVVRITGNPGNNGKKLKAVIYDDDGVGGKPLTRIAVGEEVTITAPDLDGDVQLTFEIPRYLPPGTWYFGVHTDGVVEFYGSDGVSVATVDPYADGTAPTFGADTEKDVKLHVTARYRSAGKAPPQWDSSVLRFDGSTRFDRASA